MRLITVTSAVVEVFLSPSESKNCKNFWKTILFFFFFWKESSKEWCIKGHI